MRRPVYLAGLLYQKHKCVTTFVFDLITIIVTTEVYSMNNIMRSYFDELHCCRPNVVCSLQLATCVVVSTFEVMLMDFASSHESIPHGYAQLPLLADERTVKIAMSS